jgi:hypothetical protein
VPPVPVPPVPVPPGFTGPGLEVPVAEPTVTGPRCAPAAYAPRKIATSSSRKPHSFAAGVTGPSPSSPVHRRGRPALVHRRGRRDAAPLIIVPGDMISDRRNADGR